MGLLNKYIQEYTTQLGKGEIQKAYRGIMTFMSDLKTYLENKHPDFAVSALYPGYMDMTYFSFTPPGLRSRKLKIAIVFLHAEGRFELWLAGNNRQIQASYIELLSQIDIGEYQRSQAGPGVDSIIVSSIAGQPDFEHLEELKTHIEINTITFAKDIERILA